MAAPPLRLRIRVWLRRRRQVGLGRRQRKGEGLQMLRSRCLGPFASCAPALARGRPLKCRGPSRSAGKVLRGRGPRRARSAFAAGPLGRQERADAGGRGPRDPDNDEQSGGPKNSHKNKRGFQLLSEHEYRWAKEGQSLTLWFAGPDDHALTFLPY